MAETLSGKVALLTGCSSGIGGATALVFARQGARVIVADGGVDGVEETITLIRNTGGQATLIKTDVTQAVDIGNLIGKTVETYGQLDCAFNNAGSAGDLSLTADRSEKHWNRVININLRGVWLGKKHAITHMLTHGSGTIVNTGSVLGLAGIIGQIAYVAAKHGVVGLIKTAALEYAKSGIRINAVCPGVIQTPRVESVINAQPVVWLCSDAASFVTGHAMASHGGYVAQ